MRVRFEWVAKNPLELPVSYHRIVQGIIYKNIDTGTGYSDFVHNEGYAYDRRKYRMFCFSNIFGKYSVLNKRISFSGLLALEVSSPDVYLIRTLSDQVMNNGLSFDQINYKDIDVFLSDYTVEEEEVFVRALSPITVYRTDIKKKTIYLSPDEDDFSFAVNENFQRKYAAYFGVPARCNVVITPVEVKDTDKCVTTYKGVYITGYQGLYQLSGSRKALDFLMQTGVGSKNAQGFGMIGFMD